MAAEVAADGQQPAARPGFTQINLDDSPWLHQAQESRKQSRSGRPPIGSAAARHLCTSYDSQCFIYDHRTPQLQPVLGLHSHGQNFGAELAVAGWAPRRHLAALALLAAQPCVPQN